MGSIKKRKVKEPVLRPLAPFLKLAMERSMKAGPGMSERDEEISPSDAVMSNPDDDRRNVEIDVIDYSRIIFRSVLPLRRKGKFIQVTDGDTEYVVLAPYELATHHALILERFCMQRELKGIWIQKPSVFRIIGREWEALGGGHFVIDDEERFLRLFGESTSYGSFDRDGLKGKLATLPAFQGYSILIG